MYSCPSPAKRRRLNSPADGASFCPGRLLVNNVPGAADSIVDPFSNGPGGVTQFERLALSDLVTARRESNLRNQYYIALAEAARKYAVAFREHADTMQMLIALKRDIGAPHI